MTIDFCKKGIHEIKSSVNQTNAKKHFQPELRGYLLSHQKTGRELNRQFRDCNRELVQAAAGIGKQDVIMQKLYEDNVEGNINERCVRISASCETVQKLQQVRKAELEL